MKTPIGKRKILIVDDDRTLTDMYGMKFEREGWEVMKSHDGVS